MLRRSFLATAGSFLVVHVFVVVVIADQTPQRPNPRHHHPDGSRQRTQGDHALDRHGPSFQSGGIGKGRDFLSEFETTAGQVHVLVPFGRFEFVERRRGSRREGVVFVESALLGGFAHGHLAMAVDGKDIAMAVFVVVRIAEINSEGRGRIRLAVVFLVVVGVTAIEQFRRPFATMFQLQQGEQCLRKEGSFHVFSPAVLVLDERLVVTSRRKRR